MYRYIISCSFGMKINKMYFIKNSILYRILRLAMITTFFYYDHKGHTFQNKRTINMAALTFTLNNLIYFYNSRDCSDNKNKRSKIRQGAHRSF